MFVTSTSPTSPSFRTPLQRVIHEEGRKQRWLAERVGIDEGMLSRYANGLHCPEHTRAAIAEALGRSVDEVFPEGTA